MASNKDLEQASRAAPADVSILVQETGHAAQQEDHNKSKWEAIKENPTNFLWALYGAWALVVIAFDNQAGGIVISIPEFRKNYGYAFDGGYVINAGWQSAFSGGPVAASILASLAGGYLADRFGRKWMITIGLAITFVGVAVEFASTTVQVFFAGKFINGIALGILLTSVLSWVSEVSPLALRGLMTGLCNVSFCVGPFVAVLIQNSISTEMNKWAYRSLFVAQWGFGFTSIIVAPFMPESPWWLISKGKEELALKHLRRLGHSELSAENHLAIMKVTQNAAQEESAGTSYLECFRGTNLRRTIITIMPLTIQAMSGVAYISGYGTYYFELAGISTQKSFQIACGAQALSIVGNIGAFLVIDRVGRRPLLLWAFGFLTVLLCVTGGLGTQTQNHSAVMATVALTVFYNFAYNFAIGAVSYAIIAETATSRLRAKTIAISSTIQSAFFTMWQFVLPFIFNPNAGNLGARTSFIFGGLSVICWIYLYFYQPETARRSFEEIDEMFAKRVPARKFAGYRTNAEQLGEDALSGIKNNTQHFEAKDE